MVICKSFLTNIDNNSRVLILGSLLGKKKKKKKQYYAHQQNRFWKLMELLCDCKNLSDFDYSEKLEILLDNKLALWDVIASCNRIGSLDSNIQKKTE